MSRRYQFALLRYMQDPTAGEFANVGVVMYDADAQRVLTRMSERYGRVSAFFGSVDGVAFRNMIRHVDRAILGVDESFRAPDMLEAPPEGLQGVLTLALPPDESSFRTSPVMAGFATDPEQRLEELFDEFVLRYEPQEHRERRDEGDVRRDLDHRLIRSGLSGRVKFEFSIQSATFEYTFHAAWQNGKPQVLEPISLDLADPNRIVDKANGWTGRLFHLAKGPEFAFTGLIAPPPDPTLGRAFDRAITILRNAPRVRELVLERNADRIIELIRRDTEDSSPYASPPDT